MGARRDAIQRRMVLDTPLVEAFDSRRNSLSFLRWVFAAMVVVDHSYPIGGIGSGVDPTWTWSRGQDSLGGIAVAGFFIISGFLVTRSWFSSHGTLRYLWRRFLRIFPGYWIVLLVTVFVFAPLAWRHENGGLTGVFGVSQDTPLHYITANFWLHQHQWNIGNLLTHTPFAHSGYPIGWNGSLWTLIYEFKAYLLLAVLGLVGLLRYRRAVLALAGFMYVLMLSWQVDPKWAPKLLPVLSDVFVARFSFLFLLGAVIALYIDRIVLDDRMGILALILVVVTLHQGGWLLIGYPALAYSILFLAIRLPLSKFDRYGDFSYGTYIYAFPLQMLLAEYAIAGHGTGFIFASLAVSTVAAVLSWHLVEKHALRLKNWTLPRPRRGRAVTGAERETTAPTVTVPAMDPAVGSG